MTQRCKKRLVKKYNTQSLHILRDHVRCAPAPRYNCPHLHFYFMLFCMRTCKSFYAPAPISPKLSAPEISAKSAQLCSLATDRLGKNNIRGGDKMCLQALNDGFVVLEPGVEFLYVGILTLPKVVSVSSCTNMFS